MLLVLQKLMFIIACLLMMLAVINLVFHLRQTIEDDLIQDKFTRDYDSYTLAQEDEQMAEYEAERMEDWIWG